MENVYRFQERKRYEEEMIKLLDTLKQDEYEELADEYVKFCSENDGNKTQ